MTEAWPYDAAPFNNSKSGNGLSAGDMISTTETGTVRVGDNSTGEKSEPGDPDNLIRVGRLNVDLCSRVASVDGRRVKLTKSEYAILELLIAQRGTTVTKEMFLNQLYGGVGEPEQKIIDVFICKLRKKLADATGEDQHIKTVWGRGYALDCPVLRKNSATRPAF